MTKIIFIVLLITANTLLVAQNQTDTWKTLNTHYTDMSGIIQAPAQDTVFIHRMDGALIRSFNGGNSWDSTFIRHDSIRFTDVGSTFVNGKVGFTWSIWGCMYTGIKQERAVLLKTTNSGTNWSVAMNGLPLQLIKSISMVHFWDKDNGIVVAECEGSHHENHIYMTFDGANTWVESSAFNADINYAPRMASFTDRYTGIMCGLQLNLNFSTTDNGGYDWKNTKVHQLNYSPTGIKLFNNNNGFILANDSVFVTDNNFNLFTRKALPFVNYNNSVLSNNNSFYSYDDKTTYFLTFNDGIYKTTNSFNSYTVSKQKNNLPNYSIAGFNKDVYVYGLNGLVYKTTIGASENNEELVSKKNVTLFPNPTSGNVLNITSKTEISYYTLFNVLGMQLENASLANNQIDITKLATGTYILTVYNAQNELFETTKFVKTNNK